MIIRFQTKRRNTNNKSNHQQRKTESSSEFDFTAAAAAKKDSDFTIQFMIDASLIQRTSTTSASRRSIFQKQDAETETEALPEDTLMLSEDIASIVTQENNEQVLSKHKFKSPIYFDVRFRIRL